MRVRSSSTPCSRSRTSSSRFDAAFVHARRRRPCCAPSTVARCGCPTSSSAERKQRRRTSRVSGARRTAVIFLGADEDVFCETWSPRIPFSALYVADAVTRRGRGGREPRARAPGRIAEPREIPPSDRGLPSRTRASCSAASASRARSHRPSSRRSPRRAGDHRGHRGRARAARGRRVCAARRAGDGEALADAIRRLASDDELRRAIAARANSVYARAREQARRSARAGAQALEPAAEGGGCSVVVGPGRR